jgi:phosphohistidine phosphatase
MRKVAKAMRAARVSPTLILTSPLPRASQTAEIAAEQLEVPLTEEPLLAPGFNAKRLAGIFKNYPNQDLMIVGHEPDFSSTIASLTRARVKLAKAGLARVDLDGADDKEARLRWLLSPKLMIRLSSY